MPSGWFEIALADLPPVTEGGREQYPTVHQYEIQNTRIHLYRLLIDEFDRFDPDKARLTNAERVLRFLVRNRENAYKAAEIAAATKVAENSIHPTLNRLENRDLVRHKEPYWAIGDLDHVREAFVFQSNAAFLDEELGAESREGWLTAAANTDGEDA